jgi:16S rRNA (guanine966-N2)-methyltransferase
MSIRIIGGIRRGALLSTREGPATRPLLARVRQSLFDMLGTWVSGSRVLDLFAGSGAVGLEALSRGAEWATLVDRDAEALGILGRNIGKLRFADRCRAVRSELPRAADTLPLPPDMKPYDLLFIMPPFGHDLLGPTLDALAARADLFAPLTFVVGQLQSDERIPIPPPEFQKIEERLYGQTRLLFWRRESVSEQK